MLHGRPRSKFTAVFEILSNTLMRLMEFAMHNSQESAVFAHLALLYLSQNRWHINPGLHNIILFSFFFFLLDDVSFYNHSQSIIFYDITLST